MNTAPNNPSNNILGAGVSDTDLISAIEKSGYPLQTVIAEYLSTSFRVQEEWSYIDRDTKELRTLDLVASKPLFELDEKQPRVRPEINLLIECKQSDLPFVFFLSKSIPWLPEFPFLAGLASNTVVVTSDDDPSSWSFTVQSILGLENHSFLSEPPYCSTLSKCVRRGSNLELSGTETYNGLILPLIKALLHFRTAQAPPKTAMFFDCHLALAVAVVDAPMVGVEVSSKGNVYTLTPWVRVLRNEASENDDLVERSKDFAIDVVHKDFFPVYLERHVLKYCSQFSDLALKYQEILAIGKGFISGMGADSWDNLTARLEIASSITPVQRVAALGRNALRQASSKRRSPEVE